MRKKILLIDDEPDVVTYLKTFLGDHGYAVCDARDVEKGLVLASREKPDLICLDIMMPERSGIFFYDALRKSDTLCAIPIIVVSGLNEDALQVMIESLEGTGRPAGSHQFVAKPVDLHQFLAAVRKALGEAS